MPGILLQTTVCHHDDDVDSDDDDSGDLMILKWHDFDDIDIAQ